MYLTECRFYRDAFFRKNLSCLTEAAHQINCDKSLMALGPNSHRSRKENHFYTRKLKESLPAGWQGFSPKSNDYSLWEEK
jgi:hypothetical protein